MGLSVGCSGIERDKWVGPMMLAVDALTAVTKLIRSVVVFQAWDAPH